jgi:transposase
MRPRTAISPEQHEVLETLLRESKTKSDYQRVQAVWLRSALDLPAAQVAQAIGWSEGRVKTVQSRFLREGAQALAGTGRGGRRRQNLRVEQEDTLLASFLEQAKAGGVLVAGEVKKAYEDAVGHSVPKSTVYRMLERHDWRKIAPRPRHPNDDPAAREAFKKKNSQKA